jgi:hypothetical protein
MNHPSRRQLLKLLAVTTGAATTGKNATAVEAWEDLASQLSESVTLHVSRAEDMLELELKYIGFRRSPDGQSLRKTSSPALLIVSFEPQSLAEEAFEEAAAPGEAQIENRTDEQLRGRDPASITNKSLQFPARTMLAGRSRLVFAIPTSINSLPLTAEGLLNWDRFTPVVNKRAASPRTPPLFNLSDASDLYQQITPPSGGPSLPTTGPMPKKTVATPSLPSISTKADPSRKAQLNQQLRSASRSEEETIRRQLAPEMSTSGSPDLRLGKTPRPVHPEETCIEMPWRLFLSPNPYSKWQHEYSLQAPPVSAGALGKTYELWHTRLACADCHGGKDLSEALAPLRSVRALWARDANGDPRARPNRSTPYATSLYADDRHSIVHESSNWGIPGFTPRAIQVNHLLLTALGGWLDGELTVKREELESAGVIGSLNILKWKHIATMARDHHVEVVYAGNIFPFGHEASLVRITQRRPQQGYAVNRQRYFIAISEERKKFDSHDPQSGKFMEFPFTTIQILTSATPTLDSPVAFSRDISGPADQQFIPQVDGKPWLFKILGFDAEGQETDFQLPLVFLSTSITRTPEGRTNNRNIQRLIEQYNKRSSIGKDISLRNQRLALAKSENPGDTTVEVSRLQIEATPHQDAPGFHPKLGKLDVFLDAVENMTGQKEAVTIALKDDESNKPKRQRKNKSGVFAEILSNTPVVFGDGGGKGKGKVKGGLMPDFNMSGLSKTFGVFGGDIPAALDMRFDPKKFFSSTAKLFGSISLADILQTANTADLLTGGELTSTAFPALKHKNTPQAVITEYIWNAATLKTYDFGVGTFRPKNNRAGNIVVEARLKRFKQPAKSPLFELDSYIRDFKIELAGLAAVQFKKVGFKVDSTTKLDFTVDMDRNPIKFMGALSFVNDLQKYIPGDGFSDPPFLDVKKDHVLAGYTQGLPDIQLGVFTLRKITLSASVKLPFFGAPMVMRFAFCEKQQPFMLTVSALGGGGYLALEFDMNGLRMLEAALEFGAAVSLDLGVASGSVKVVGGIYFKTVFSDGGNTYELSGYIRINGALSVLSLITVSVSFLMALKAEFKEVNGESKVSKVWGEAKLRVKVEVFMFSKTVNLQLRREFAGAGADPTFGMLISEQDWLTYCDSFAA